MIGSDKRGDAVQAKASLSQKSRHQLQQYLSQHGLERDPFSDEGTRGLFFSGAGRKQAVDSLLHFSRYGTTPVFLTGPTGAGKTAVLREFCSALENDICLASVDVTLMLAPEKLFSSLVEAFSLTVSSEPSPELSTLADALLEFSRRQRAAERQALICLDNVQDLSLDTLQALLALVTESEGDLAMLLVGDRAATAVLETEASAFGLLINRIELPQLERHDLAAYLRYRLDSAGYRGDFPLIEVQLQALQQRSQDSLRQLNQLARSMLIATAESSQGWRSPFPLTHSLLLAALFAVIFYYWPAAESSDPAAVAREPIALVGAADRSAAPDSASVAAARNAELQARINVRRPSLPASTVLAGAAPTPAVEMPRASVVEDAAEDVAEEAVANGELRPAEPHLINKSPAVRERLLSWSPLGYALQVFGTHDAKRARQLADRYSVEVALLYYETRYKGKPWYVVVSGPYSGREAAKAHIEELPQALRRLRPWPRNIASIQADLRRYNAVVERAARP